MKYYGIYTQRFIQDGTFTDDASLNGYYDLSFFQDYEKYRLPVSIVDGDRVISSLQLKTEFKSFIVDSELPLEDIVEMSKYIPSEFNVQLLDNDSFCEWVKANTNLQEVEPRKFLISLEREYMGIVYPAKYLTIE